METPAIQISPSQLPLLRVVVQLGEEKLSALVKNLAESSELPTRISEVEELFQQTLEESSGSIVRLCLSFQPMIQDLGAEWVVEALENGLTQLLSKNNAAAESDEDAVSEEELAGWRSCRNQFQALLESEHIRSVAKHLELSYEYGRLWRTGRILTDIRPIYNQEGSEIRSALVSYTMRLTFHSEDGDHSESFAMDEADVKALAHECERALRKAETARNLMVEKAGIKTNITG